MSITAETAKEHANDPAVLCCRAEAGVTIEAANLEDPAIFDDLVDSGLLNLDGALTIGQILGATLTKTCDSLTPVTADVVDGAKAAPVAPAAPVEEAPAAPVAPIAPMAAAPAGTLKIHIGEGKDINLEIPMGLSGGQAAVAALPEGAVVAGAAAVDQEAKVVRSLTRKHFKITEVKRGPETKIEGTTLYIREGIEADAVDSQVLVHDMKIDIITPELYHTYSETVMDVLPIATKEG
ncbi:MAG: D-proline reductase (dithiol) proprotein PrdA, partial [Lachnospiraceae bacterium]